MPGRTENARPCACPGPGDKDPAENHHFNVTQLGKAERVKDIFLWWIDSDAGLPLAGDGLKGIKKIGLLLLLQPARHARLIR